MYVEPWDIKMSLGDVIAMESELSIGEAILTYQAASL